MIFNISGGGGGGGGGTMQTKSVSYTPSESSQSGTVTPDTGYDGLSSVSVSVGAISSDYVGSGVTRRSSSDLTASDATVSVPAGYYENAASKTIVSGRPGTPIAGKSPASNLHTITITPSVSNSAGWIPSGMIVGEDVTVSASELVSGTLNVTSSGTKDVTNYAEASIPAGSATASATKGTVSNHSVSVTPSVTKSAGWINTGSSNGPAVTVSASELDSGTKSITQNGTGIDVVGYAAVDVSVSGGADMPTFTLDSTMTSVTCDKTFAECMAYANNDITTALVDTPYGLMTAYNTDGSVSDMRYVLSDPVPEVDIVYNSNGTINLVSPSTYRETLSVTQNGTYYPSRQNKAITEVTVNVPSSQPTLQSKTKTYTPSTSQQTESVTADNGYDGLSAVNVEVNAISPTKAAATYYPSTSDQNVALGQWLTGAQTFKGVVLTNLTAANIKSGVVVEVGDAQKSNRIAEITGTYVAASKNAQVVQGTTRTTSATLTAIGAEMTVSKTGTYDVYWTATRSNTSTQYTFGTQLYINGTAYGTEQTGSWSNQVQNIHLSNVSLTQNQTLRVYGRESRGSSYYMYAPMLTIVEA